MKWADVLERLETGAFREIVDRAILDRRPWIFDTDEDYNTWQQFVRDALGSSVVEIKIVGSAATGFSLSPLKAGRPFRPLIDPKTQSSDVDVAVFNPQLFEGSWNALIAYDRVSGFGGSDEATRMRVNVYNGFVAANKVPFKTEPARWFTKIATVLNRARPLRGYPLRFRVYRRLEDLQAYHVLSLRQLHRELQMTGG